MRLPQEQHVGRMLPRSRFEERVIVSSQPQSGLGQRKVSPVCHPMVAPPVLPEDGSLSGSGRRATEPLRRAMLCSFFCTDRRF